MAGRSHPTFKKRQKEQARKEKQRNKAERKAQRKLEKLAGIAAPDLDVAVAPADSQPDVLPPGVIEPSSPADPQDGE